MLLPGEGAEPEADMAHVCRLLHRALLSTAAAPKSSCTASTPHWGQAFPVLPQAYSSSKKKLFPFAASLFITTELPVSVTQRKV